jgi:Holliday junction resolvase
MAKRSGKFYFRNEREVMESLGLKQVKGSGNVWNSSREDGENEYLLCQLKSTDAQSIRVQQVDIRKLEEHAQLSHRTPLFAIQFLNTQEVWLMMKPEDVPFVSEYIKTGKTEKRENVIEVKDVKQKKVKVIASSSDAREQFESERRSKYNKTKSAT